MFKKFRIVIFLSLHFISFSYFFHHEGVLFAGFGFLMDELASSSRQKNFRCRSYFEFVDVLAGTFDFELGDMQISLGSFIGLSFAILCISPYFKSFKLIFFFCHFQGLRLVNDHFSSFLRYYFVLDPQI